MGFAPDWRGLENRLRRRSNKRARGKALGEADPTCLLLLLLPSQSSSVVHLRNWDLNRSRSESKAD